jgi:hypothetical protein
VRRVAVFGWLGLLLAAIPQGRLCASVFNRDDRITEPADVHGASAPIGMMWADKLATGFLVSQCHVLSVRHVFEGVAPAIGRRAVFGALARDAGHWTASWGTVVAAGEVNGDPTDYDSVRAADWLLVRLDTCLGKKLGFVSLSSEPPSLARDLKSAGYPYDRRGSGGVTIDPACRIAGTRERVWLNDCAALAGNSGSPIFSEIQVNGRTALRVYAMQSAAHDSTAPVPFNPALANVATPMAGIIPQIAGIIGQPRAKHAVEQPVEIAVLKP